MFINVDLPEPDEPMMAINSPRRTVRLTPRSAWTVTSPRVKARVTSSILMIGSDIAGLSRGIEAGLRSVAAPSLTGGLPDVVFGGDDVVAWLEIAFDDLGEVAVVETQHNRQRNGLSVAQHPDAALSAYRGPGPGPARPPGA